MSRRLTTFTSAAFAAIAVSLAALVTLDPHALSSSVIATIFAVAYAIAFFSAYSVALSEKRLPSLSGRPPRNEHISGWAVIFTLASIGSVIALANWASNVVGEQAIGSAISMIVFWSVVAMLLAAIFPMPSVPLSGAILAPIRWLGTSASYADLVLAHVVYGSVAAEERSPSLRYGITGSMFAASSVLAYFLEPPWSFVPISCTFMVALALFRRWGLVETDRETAIAEGRFEGPGIAVGFRRNLRADVLFACVILLLLLPLTLRQCQLWSTAVGAPLFDATPAATNDYFVWVKLVGAELAKALPFVDWAEVYDVRATGSLAIAHESVAARHLIFSTRAIIDFVIVGTIARAAAASAAEQAQLRLLFEMKLRQLDPFLEAREFKKLVRRNSNGDWEPSESLLQFPQYDEDRLEVLALHPDERIRAAARFILDRQASHSGAN